jgi:hypothetical protein
MSTVCAAHELTASCIRATVCLTSYLADRYRSGDAATKMNTQIHDLDISGAAAVPLDDVQRTIDRIIRDSYGNDDSGVLKNIETSDGASLHVDLDRDEDSACFDEQVLRVRTYNVSEPVQPFMVHLARAFVELATMLVNVLFLTVNAVDGVVGRVYAVMDTYVRTRAQQVNAARNDMAPVLGADVAAAAERAVPYRRVRVPITAATTTHTTVPLRYETTVPMRWSSSVLAYALARVSKQIVYGDRQY